MTERSAAKTTPGGISVRAHARLHMGFLDLNGGLGRHFGSIGLAPESPVTALQLTHADRRGASGPAAARALALLERLGNLLDLQTTAHIRLQSAIPEHAGFGSGTQLALAVGTALARLLGLDSSAAEIALLLDRGARSGVGLGAFEQGGFIVDGGHGGGSGTPPVVARLPFPEAWRVVLILDRRRRGVHGDNERGAFGELPEFPAASAAHLCRLVLMQALPALVEQDIAPFGAAISDIQRCVGDHFAQAQGGRYASPEVAALLEWMERNGAAGVGQSSWGPTGFAVCESEAAATDLAARATALGLPGETVELQICAARNRGADLWTDVSATTREHAAGLLAAAPEDSIARERQR